jgi:hypothetical protein
MKDDAIVAEMRRLRQQHAESFDCDLYRIFDDPKRSEAARRPEESPPAVSADTPKGAKLPARRVRLVRD